MEKKVIVSFLYNAVKGKDDQYYKDLAFNEIYNKDDVLQSEGFEVENYKEKQL